MYSVNDTHFIDQIFEEKKNYTFVYLLFSYNFSTIYFSSFVFSLQIQVSSMCMCLMISASVSLACLFLPKVYLVLFQPYKNVRNATGLSVNRVRIFCIFISNTTQIYFAHFVDTKIVKVETVHFYFICNFSKHQI